MHICPTVHTMLKADAAGGSPLHPGLLLLLYPPIQLFSSRFAGDHCVKTTGRFCGLCGLLDQSPLHNLSSKWSETRLDWFYLCVRNASEFINSESSSRWPSEEWNHELRISAGVCSVYPARNFWTVLAWACLILALVIFVAEGIK